jgi:hypothetical protein
MGFNLKSALVAAEAGDATQWEAIARHLLAKQSNPKPRKAASGPQTWAHVVLQDGREYLTSAYARSTQAQTIAAHGDYAQYRARMEDSGDRSDYGQTAPLGPMRRYRNVSNADFAARAFLDPKVQAVPVKLVTLLDDPAQIEQARDRCFEQRGRRQGWWAAYQQQAAGQVAA